VSGWLVGSGFAPPAPGFFGKVASHGDFVARRLPPAFLSGWDGWLQAGLRHSRERLGEAWLEIYLNSPIWRFALAAGIGGPSAWAGVLMPSVDRVGRHFPLTLAGAPSGAGVSPLALLEGAAAWYGRLETLAWSALADGFDLERFDAALLDLGPPDAGAPAVMADAVGDAEAVWLALPGRAESAAPSLMRRIADAALAGHGLFWTEGSPRLAPSLLACRGLPSGPTFADMLAGRPVE
jgi:type VI secretion system protein ImpM